MGVGKNRNGDYIELYWDDVRDFEVLRGHIEDEEARKILYKERYIDPDYFESCDHSYARWEFCESSEYDRGLVLHNESGRGKFKVTVLWRKGYGQEIVDLFKGNYDHFVLGCRMCEKSKDACNQCYFKNMVNEHKKYLEDKINLHKNVVKDLDYFEVK